MPLPIVNFGSPIGSALPMRNMPFANPIDWDSHLVMIVSASQDTFTVPMLPKLFIGLLAVFFLVVAKRIRVSVN